MNPSDPTIFLVGPMGSGKTTIGRRVAKRLGRDFFDCDEEIERRTGASVNLIFDIEGETGFRERESQLLRELSDRPKAVIATGGGCILDADNRRLMREGGLVVWLRASVGQQLRRLQNDKKRPLLQAPDRRERLMAMAETRDPLYAETAHLVFQSGRRSVASMANELALTLHDRLRALAEGADHAVH